MTKEEFSFQFDKLTQAFSVTRAEEKTKIYFEELRSISVAAFSEVVRRIIRESDRFPTIAALLQKADSICPKNEQTHAAKCVHCDGYGWVIFDRHAFRGRCEHGRALSARIAFSPESEIDRINWKNRIEREQTKCN